MRVAAHYAEAPSAICVDLGAIFVSLLVWTARAALKLSRSDLSLTAGVRYTAVVVFEGGKSVAPEIVSALKQALEARGADFGEADIENVPHVGVYVPADETL